MRHPASTINRTLSRCRLCYHWQHFRLSLRQPAVPSVTELASWHLSVCCVGYHYIMVNIAQITHKSTRHSSASRARYACLLQLKSMIYVTFAITVLHKMVKFHVEKPGSIWEWTQPMRVGVTMYRLLSLVETIPSLAEPIPRMIPEEVESTRLHPTSRAMQSIAGFLIHST